MISPADCPLRDLEFVAFDLETTGLGGACQIVEFGAVRFRLDGTELDRMSQLVNPGCPIPQGAWYVHHISDEMVRDQPPLEAVLPRFLEFIGDERTLLLAHNASFDLSFLRSAIARCQTPVPGHVVVDHLRLARRRLPELPTHKLDHLARRFQASGGVEHRALSDSLVLKSVFLNLVARPPAIGSLDDLHRFAPPMRFVEPAAVLVLPAVETVPGTADPEPPPETTEVLSLAALSDHLSLAIHRRRSVTMIYEGGSKGLAERTVTPLALRRRQGGVFLVAFCHIDRQRKSYRLDRIRQFRVDAR